MTTPVGSARAGTLPWSLGAAAPPASSSPGTEILPPPGVSDPVLEIGYFESKDQQLDLDTGSKRLQGLQKEQNDDFQKELKAINDMVQAETHQSFWDSLGNVFGEIAKVAGVVASIAAAVATCGAGSPLAAVAVAGATLSAAGFADGETHVLEKLGLSADVAGILDAGMSIGGAVASVGAGMLSGASAASSTATTVSRVAAATAGVGLVGQGVGAIGSGLARRDEDKAAAGEESSEADQALLRRLVAQLQQEVQSDVQQSSKGIQTVVGTERIEQQTALAAAGGKDGF